MGRESVFGYHNLLRHSRENSMEILIKLSRKTPHKLMVVLLGFTPGQDHGEETEKKTSLMKTLTTSMTSIVRPYMQDIERFKSLMFFSHAG